jgi:ABC-type multidrug transport system fused ATPase/permease subunit
MYYIYFLVDGHIAERGTFKEIMANRGEFSRAFDEFVTDSQKD